MAVGWERMYLFFQEKQLGRNVLLVLDRLWRMISLIILLQLEIPQEL